MRLFKVAVKIRPKPIQATKSGSLAAVLPVAPKLLALLLTPPQRAGLSNQYYPYPKPQKPEKHCSP